MEKQNMCTFTPEEKLVYLIAREYDDYFNFLDRKWTIASDYAISLGIGFTQNIINQIIEYKKYLRSLFVIGNPEYIKHHYDNYVSPNLSKTEKQTINFLVINEFCNIYSLDIRSALQTSVIYRLNFEDEKTIYKNFMNIHWLNQSLDGYVEYHTKHFNKKYKARL